VSLKQTNNQKKHGLGKGIGSLLDNYAYDTTLEHSLGLNPGAGEETEDASEKIEQIDLEKIRPNPNQPRKTFDENALKELSISVKNQGILQPILVEKIADDSYCIIAGERRYRAAKMAGLDKVPVIIKKLSDMQRMEISLIENIQRENLNAIEEAKAYSYLLNESGMTQEDLSHKVGKDRSTISNSIRLLQLTPQMQNDLLNGKFTAGQARAILSVVNPADREILYQTVLDKQLSVRATEQLAAEFNKGKRIAYQKKKRIAKVLGKSADLVSVEDKFLHAVGTQVEIKGSLDKGKIEIPFADSDELERIFQLIAPDDTLFDID